MHLKLKVCRCSSENPSDASGVIENGDIPLTMPLKHKTLSSEKTNELVNENNRLSCLDNNNYRKDMNNSISSDNLYINGMENNTNFSSSSDTSKTNNNVVVENDDVLILKICDLENIIREHKFKSKKSPSIIASPVKLIACKAQKCQMDNKRGSIVATVSNSSTTAAVTATTASGKKTTKSVGTQHFNSHQFATNSLVKSKKSTQNNEIIIVSDQFKAQALKNQNVVVDSKRKILKLMQSQRMNSRSLEDLRQNCDPLATNGIDNLIAGIPKNTHQSPSSQSFTKNSSPQNFAGDALKAISKSVDNVSVTSDGGVFDNFGSVELVFISDEFLNKPNNHNIIIVEENQSVSKLTKTVSQTGGPSSTGKIASTKPKKAITVSTSTDGSGTVATTSTQAKNGQKKKIISISDDFRRNSVKNKVVVLSEPRKRLKDMKLKRNSSQESSVDDVGNKITSHAFHSYDEEQENLESKELQQTHL